MEGRGRVSLIAAMSENRIIGINNKLPWHLPADLRHFRRLTTGHPVIMGRRNYESIGKPLPNRTNIVVTRNPDYRAAGCLVTHSLDDAMNSAGNDSEIFIIGGAEIYRQAFDRANRIFITLIHARIEGDTYFPEFEGPPWREISRERHERDENNPYSFSFLIYERSRN
ncbi:MAG TPA: type 3 dihydrofolate reductase [Sulfuricaulis sp.]|nr:type 3 dihydrofolate reductase [Sulfuricaulis sp.]